MKTHAQQLASILTATRAPRSAWDKGVLSYALELLESYEPETVTEEGLLNGAAHWNAYSYVGGAELYDTNIAERLCTPSELKKKQGGELRPNARETWLDVQARALVQAARLILRFAK